MRAELKTFVRVTLSITIAVVTLLFTLNSCQILVPKWDLVITNGQIIDGTGNPPYKADLGIKDDMIVEIGTLEMKRSRRIIDADGLYVTPGFIDVHTHVDRMIASQPVVMNYLLQGVTTVVGGNCGGSRYPLQELFNQLENEGTAVNFASLIGHNTTRRQIMGNEDRSPTAEELSRMQDLVKEEMLAGAIGFSTGLAYVPGRYSTTEEIIELVKTIQPFNGVYATHMRNQGKQIKESVEEAIRIGREAGVRVEIAHIKLATEDVWGRYHLITDPIEEAHRQGMEVYLDQYPYTATSSGFTSSFPGWAVAGGHEAFIERLNDPENYQKIKAAIIEKRLTSERRINRLQSIYVAKDTNHPEYEGKNLAEIMELLGRERTISNAADLIIEMQREDRPRGIFFQMDEKDVETLMQEPYSMIGSDGKVEIPGVEVPHPRAYGTFPRVLGKYVRDSGIRSLPDAIRKMTSLPAQAMRFNERGILKTGKRADIVIFSFDEIQDMATFDEPHQYPKGIHWVIVNGQVAAEQGEWTGALPGRVLYGLGAK
ncbi:MAG: D-aminoacylase [Candidatus Neomarinimicrobiota bacterium]